VHVRWRAGCDIAPNLPRSPVGWRPTCLSLPRPLGLRIPGTGPGSDSIGVGEVVRHQEGSSPPGQGQPDALSSISETGPTHDRGGVISLRALGLSGLSVFGAGLLSALFGIAFLPSSDFPPWGGGASGISLVWGWLTVAALAGGAATALTGSYLGKGTAHDGSVGPQPDSATRRLARYWPFMAGGVILALAWVTASFLGNPELLGLDSIRWAAALILVLGAVRVVIGNLRRSTGETPRGRNHSPPLN
jgi:hypothetical protein